MCSKAPPHGRQWPFVRLNGNVPQRNVLLAWCQRHFMKQTNEIKKLKKFISNYNQVKRHASERTTLHHSVQHITFCVSQLRSLKT